MYTIASIDRIRELKQEIVSLARLNALYKADSLRSDVTLKANACRGLRLLEIREELGAMKWPDSHTHRAALPRSISNQTAASDSFSERFKLKK